ncbi:MAG: hypothetical protein ACFBRM_02090 [Pikeienuella sp.]
MSFSLAPVLDRDVQTLLWLLFALAALVSAYAWALGRRPGTALLACLLLTPPVAFAVYIVLGPSRAEWSRLAASRRSLWQSWWDDTGL